MKRLCMLVLIVVFTVSLSACGNNDSPEASPVSGNNMNVIPSTEAAGTAAAQSSVPAAPKANISRAVGKGEFGELLVIPSANVHIQQLGAPSCMGGEKDYSIKSDFNIVFKHDDGTEQNIAYLKEATIVSASSTEPREIRKITLDDAELFYFQPVKNTCRADAIYLYFVNDTVAYPVSFDVENKHYDQFSQVPQAEPYVDNGQLVLESTEGDTSFKYFFRLEDKTFRLVKKEEVH